MAPRRLRAATESGSFRKPEKVSSAFALGAVGSDAALDSSVVLRAVTENFHGPRHHDAVESTKHISPKYRSCSKQFNWLKLQTIRFKNGTAKGYLWRWF